MRPPTLPLLAALLAPAVASAQTPPPGGAAPAPGPVIELAPEDRAPPGPQAPPATKRPWIALGSGPADGDALADPAEQRLRSAQASVLRTAIGGYGELMVNGVKSGLDAPTQWTADARRVVLFVAHSFNEQIRVYTELEVEHAKEAEMEQAYVDYKVLGDRLGLRAGLVLVPMGIINELHEPPIFNGVVRPAVETVVIPSTWREIGAGVFGRPTELLRYELYGMAGLDPAAFGAGGLAGSSGAGANVAGAFARAKAWSVAGRVELEPILGMVLGVSGYAGDAGGNGQFHLRDRTPVNVRVPVLGWDVDLRFKRAGLEWKVLYVEWHLPDADALMHTWDDAGHPLFPDPTSPVPTLMRGAYVEGGYDVLHWFRLSHQLVPFARIEFYDTQAGVPAGYAPNPTYSVREYTFGVSYHPIREVVVKADYQLLNRKEGKDATQINAGIGFMY
jgi:hypothetical protein